MKTYEQSTKGRVRSRSSEKSASVPPEQQAFPYAECFAEAPVGYVLLDETGEIREANRAAQTLLGTTGQPCLGVPFTNFLAPGEAEGFLHRIAALLPGGPSLTCDLCLRTTASEQKCVRLDVNAAQAARGERWLRVVLTDETEERRRQEASLSADFDRVRRETRIQAQEEQRTLLDHIRTHVWYLLDPATYGAVNEAHAAFFGLKNSEIAFRSLRETFPLEEMPLHIQANSAVFALRRPSLTEEWIAPGPGRARRLLAISRSPVLDENGKVEYVVCSAEDITVRRGAEEALRESVNRLALATRAGGVGTWYYDMVRNRLIWDAQMFNLYGIERHEFSGLYEDWQRQIHPADRRLFDEELSLLMQGHKEFEIEFRILHPKAGTRNIRALASMQRDSVGQPVRIVGTNWDITRQKNTEAALRESEANFRTFFETLTDFAFVATPEGQILLGNGAFCNLLGSVSQEAPPRFVPEVYPESCRSEVQQLIALIPEDVPVRCALPLLAQGGNTIPAETHFWRGHWNGAACILGVGKDLSAERAAQRRFERLFRNNPSLMALATVPDCRFFDVNDAFARILGYAKEEIIGKRPEEAGIFTVDTRTAGGPLAAGRELDLRCKDGTLRKGLYSEELLESQGSSFMLIVIVDITAQVQAAEALARERARLANIIRATNVGTWEWNVQTGEFLVNAIWPETLGYRMDELAPFSSNTPLQLLHPGDIEIHGSRMEQHFRGETEHFECELRMWHKDGFWKWVLVRGRIDSWTPAGEPVWMFGTHQDIHEQKLAQEEAMQRSEERFHTLLSLSNDAVFVLDETGALLKVNERACTLTGYEAAECHALHFADLYSPWCAHEAGESFSALLARGEIQFETEFLGKHGNAIPVEIGARRIAHNTSLYQVVARDISERKNLRQNLLASAEKERRNLGQELHDGLCQDLKGIEIKAMLLTEQLTTLGLPAAEDAALMETQINRAVIAAYHLAAGMLPASLDMRFFRDALWKLAAGIGKTSGADVEVRAPVNLELKNSADANHLYHIAQEAANNAVRHGAATALAFECHCGPDAFVMRIIDNGSGLDPKVKPVGGLGISVMRSRAEALGGSLSLETAPSGGVEVRCICPPNIVAGEENV